MYIMTLVPLFIVLPLIAAAAWFFRHKIKDALRRCRGRVARARHSISSGGKVSTSSRLGSNLPYNGVQNRIQTLPSILQDDAKIESAMGEFSHEMRQQQFSQGPTPQIISGYVDQDPGSGMRKLSKLSNTSVASRHFYRDARSEKLDKTQHSA